ncbi:L-fuconolactonase [Murinocardiopsis flavida]|uniref:L-fuconolactonase n=1 Tax=Murinocardiopsis flavida TaxID=645275 RepID=A0A2P8DFD9_9ACTN|nr:amidohydrolase family protein [Murinocardiopsis flavida]PSK95929.1 L-fuconolactonase [Murinocardiopsis flavida]
MSAVDAHQHFWRLAPGRYGWLGADTAPIHRDWDEGDLAPLLAGTGVARTVLVQAENTRADTDDMLAVCDRWPVAAAVVGWVPLERPTDAATALDTLGADPRFVGVRHLNHDEPDPDWLVRPAVVEGLRLLAPRGLTFDVVAVSERDLAHVATLAAELPDLTLVVDHLGAPPIASGDLRSWAGALARAAAHPNVVAKVSGLGTLTGGSDWTAEDLRPAVDRALELFTADRLMYGGDWPVSELAGGYRKVWDAIAACTADWTPHQRERLFHGTAEAVYGLPPAPAG